MKRKLTLTPFDHGVLFTANYLVSEVAELDKNENVDLPHILLSTLIMSGVDSITTFGKIDNTETKLITKGISKKELKRWCDIQGRVNTIISNYNPKTNAEKKFSGIDEFEHKLGQLLFALETNSGILSYSDFAQNDNLHEVPKELAIPYKILNDSILAKEILLPVPHYEVEKKDIRYLLDVIEGKEFANYRQAQSEIEKSHRFDQKVIKSIESAGKDLFKKNSNYFVMRDNTIKAIPLTGKVVEMFFGKLPAIVSDYAGTLLSDYLKINKSIPIYNNGKIVFDVVTGILKDQVVKAANDKELAEKILKNMNTKLIRE